MSESTIEGRLPIRVKIAYGLPNMAGSGLSIAVGIHVNIFYSDTVLLPLGFIAIAIAAARSIDAITDPLMGWITDRTRSRWGRRRPWMFVGAPLSAVAIVCLFSPPAALSLQGAAIWFVASYSLLFLFITICSVPHYGLGPELTNSYHERSSLFAWMEAASIVGILLASYVPLQLADEQMLGPRKGFLVFALGFAGMLWFFYWLLCFTVKERPDYYLREPNPLVPGIRRTLRNRPFRILLISYLVGATTSGIPALLWPYFATYVLKIPLPQQGMLLAGCFVAAFLSIPVWVRASRVWGKKITYIFARTIAATGSFLMFFLGEGQLIAAAILIALYGVSYGGSTMLGPSIQADVIDYDELHTGRRREAQYGALWAIMMKFTIIPGSAIPLGILAVAGYQPNVDQSEFVMMTISALYGIAPAIAGLGAVAVFFAYPINERVHRTILEGIRKHRLGQSALDPLTGAMLAPPPADPVEDKESWFLDHFSKRELARVRTRGGATMTLVWGASAAVLGSLATLVLAVTLVVRNLGDMGARPGMAEVLLIIAAGIALTSLSYYLIKLFAAVRFHLRRPSVVSLD